MNNEIVNKFLLAGDKFIPAMHLKQPGFTYSARGPFTKNKEQIQKLKKTGDTNFIYKNELDKACFQHDMTYEDFKDIKRRTASDKILRDKAFNIAKNPGYQRGLASIVYKCFDKRSADSGIVNTNNNYNNNNSNKQNKRSLDLTAPQLAEKLQKPIIRKF